MSKICCLIIDTYDDQLFARIAVQNCIDSGLFADTIVLSHNPIHPETVFYKINKISNIQEYNELVINFPAYLTDYYDYFLIFQWDGFIINQRQWSNDFLKYDYIGAPWPEFESEYDVGNGGFSLRSKKFITTCKKIGKNIDFENTHVGEDEIFCRRLRAIMDSSHIQFAPRLVSSTFSFEYKYVANTFGFHGAYNLPFLFNEDFLIYNSSEILNRISIGPIYESFLKASKIMNYNRLVDILCNEDR